MRKFRSLNAPSSRSRLDDPNLIARYAEILHLRKMLAEAEKKQATKSPVKRRRAPRSPREKSWPSRDGA